MKFKNELIKYFQKNIRHWEVKLSEEADIIIIVKEDRILKISYQNFKSILWLTLPEIPAKAEKVRFIITDINRTIEYYYTFKSTTGGIDVDGPGGEIGDNPPI